MLQPVRQKMTVPGRQPQRRLGLSEKEMYGNLQIPNGEETSIYHSNILFMDT